MNLRIWGELLFLVVVLIVIIIAIVSSFNYYSTRLVVVNRRRKLLPAEWVATDYTDGNETVVIVELRRPVSKKSDEFEILDRRDVGRITNGVQDYDRHYYNNMQEANNRAIVLNSLHR